MKTIQNIILFAFSNLIVRWTEKQFLWKGRKLTLLISFNVNVRHSKTYFNKLQVLQDFTQCVMQRQTFLEHRQNSLTGFYFGITLTTCKTEIIQLNSRFPRHSRFVF